ncbi:protein-tyrosine phosphatase-like protein [Syncephalis fuscata]|nr:protein-tyrosine phosphatase-like protein [Syncephalis fuscata]
MSNSALPNSNNNSDINCSSTDYSSERQSASFMPTLLSTSLSGHQYQHHLQSTSSTSARSLAIDQSTALATSGVNGTISNTTANQLHLEQFSGDFSASSNFMQVDSPFFESRPASGPQDLEFMNDDNHHHHNNNNNNNNGISSNTDNSESACTTMTPLTFQASSFPHPSMVSASNGNSHSSNTADNNNNNNKITQLNQRLHTDRFHLPLSSDYPDGNRSLFSPCTPFNGADTNNHRQSTDSYFNTDQPLPSSPNMLTTPSASLVSPFFASTPAIAPVQTPHISMPDPTATINAHDSARAAFAAAIAAASPRGMQLPARLAMVPPKSMPNLTGINRSQSLASRPNMAAAMAGHNKSSSISAATPQPCESFECDELVKLLSSLASVDCSVLLLDVRPMPQQRARGRLRNAVPVCISSTLLKRASFNVDRVGDLLASEEDRSRLLAWRQYQYVVVYDASATTLTEQGPVASLCRKFQREQTEPHSPAHEHTATIGWLKGGFDNVAAKYPDWIEDAAEDVTPCELPSATQRNAQQAAAALASSGPLTCPTPMLENTPFFSSLMDSVCQGRTYYRTCPDESPTFRLPPNYSSHIAREEAKVKLAALPAWLQHAAIEVKRLATQFETIETEEQDRLRRLLIRHSRNLPATTATCPADQYSIQAGLQHPGSNRYCNIWPYDRNRVCLTTAESGDNDIDSDYINASHVSAALHIPEAPEYIVCQGPLPVTFAAFWWMCWAQQTQAIVMLTQEIEHGRLKCHTYWPSNVGEIVSYGTLTVQLVEEIALPDNLPGIHRRILLKRPSTGEARYIHQIHYKGWPDHGVPEDPSSVIRLRQYVMQFRHPSPALKQTGQSATTPPLVVHCSAGCGRSGVFCVLDTLLAEEKRQSQLLLATNGAKSSSPSLQGNQDMVQQLVSLFRTQRIDMVQTFGQFLLCYEALAWHFIDENSRNITTAN